VEPATISIPVDSETAKLYENASEEDQRKLRLLMSLWLHNFISSPRPLGVIMDEASEIAEQNGLTPEILESILNAE
jgi:hypothetical protein